jgi:hypothetical protein
LLLSLVNVPRGIAAAAAANHKARVQTG